MTIQSGQIRKSLVLRSFVSFTFRGGLNLEGGPSGEFDVFFRILNDYEPPGTCSMKILNIPSSLRDPRYWTILR